MKLRRFLWLAPIVTIFAVFLVLAPPETFGKAAPESGGPGFRAGLTLGYLSRSLSADDKEQDASPKTTSLLAGVVLEYQFQPGFAIAVQVGYSATNFDALTFRGLPFSVSLDRDSGKIGGLLLGAEVQKSLLSRGAFRADIRGQFLASFGMAKEWSLKGLAVEGSAKGTPTWMKASVGPVLAYQMGEGVCPFLNPRFDYLWGSFEFKETVQDLKGNEKKDIKGKGRFAVGLGSDFDLTASLRIRAEASLYPHGDSVDSSFTIQTLLAF